MAKTSRRTEKWGRGGFPFGDTTSALRCGQHDTFLQKRVEFLDGNQGFWIGVLPEFFLITGDLSSALTENSM